MNADHTEPVSTSGVEATKDGRLAESFPHEIKLENATIRVLSGTQFEVIDLPWRFVLGPFYIPDTRDLDPIKALLAKPEWDELQLNSAVAELNRDPEQERRDYLKALGDYLKALKCEAATESNEDT